jgi:hypothetical protein
VESDQRGNQNPYIEEEQTAQWPNVRRYQRGNYNPYIEEEQTTQWPKDTKEAIIIRMSKKNRQHNGQKKKYQRTNNVE